MRRQLVHLHTHYTNAIHKLMAELQNSPHPDDPLQHTLTTLHTNYPHLAHWTDDPLVTSTDPQRHRLHMDLAIHIIYTILLTSCESEESTRYAVLLMVVLWRADLQVSVRQDRLDRFMESDSNEKVTNMAKRFLADNNAMVPIIWSRAMAMDEPSSEHTNANMIIASVFDKRVRFGEHRKMVRKFADEMDRQARRPPTGISSALPKLTAMLDKYTAAKNKALNKAKFSGKSRLWKSGLQLIRENFGVYISELLEGISSGCTSIVHDPDVDDDEYMVKRARLESDNPVVSATTSTVRKESSSSSSSGTSRSSTPLQEAEDMPNIM